MKSGRPGQLLAACLLLLCALSLVNQAFAETLNVTAVVLSRANCSFNTDAAVLDFGTLNPLVAQDVTVPANQPLTFICRGNGNQDITFAVTVTDSTNGSAAAPRMRHEDGADYLPYSVSVNPTSGSTPPHRGNQAPISVYITGTVNHDDFRFAPVGAYDDTLTVTVRP